MTKTSGRKIRCMTCRREFNGGRNDNKPCPYCTGKIRENNKVRKRLK